MTGWALITFLAMYGVFGGMSSVLCLGESGHSALESPVMACCTTTFEDFSFPGIRNSDSESQYCGDCNDLEVQSQLSRHRAESNRSLAAYLALTADMAAPVFLAPSLSNAQPFTPPARASNYFSSSFISQQIVASTIIIC